MRMHALVPLISCHGLGHGRALKHREFGEQQQQHWPRQSHGLCTCIRARRR